MGPYWRPRPRETIIALAFTLNRTAGAETPHLARKPNYGFEKRKKEMDRKAKKDAKREDRRRREEEARADDTADSPPPATTEPGGDPTAP